VGLAVLAGAGVWWWRRTSGHRRLLFLGLGFILMPYLLMYSARAAWPYDTQVRFWSRYNVFPQLGVALVVCAGLAYRTKETEDSEQTDELSRRQFVQMRWLIAILFVVQLPHAVVGSPKYEPRQMEILRQVEEVDARCQAHHISRKLARAVLQPLPVPNSYEEANVWLFLRGSDDPRPMSEAEARQILQP
jgi:hypothetical protein